MPESVREKVFARNGNIVSRRVAGETILVPVTGRLADMQRIFALNALGEFIWELLDGKTALPEIRDKVVDAFDVDAARAESDIRDFLAELLDADVVMGAD